MVASRASMVERGREDGESGRFANCLGVGERGVRKTL